MAPYESGARRYSPIKRNVSLVKMGREIYDGLLKSIKLNLTLCMACIKNVGPQSLVSGNGVTITSQKG